MNALCSDPSPRGCFQLRCELRHPPEYNSAAMIGLRVLDSCTLARGPRLVEAIAPATDFLRLRGILR